MTVLRLAITRVAMRMPATLVVFIAAIFLSNGVNMFTTIYAVPGKPVHSLALWCSAVTSITAAGFWTALATKKDMIDKAVLSGAADQGSRVKLREDIWADVWRRVMVYLLGAAALSVLAMAVLVLPP